MAVGALLLALLVAALPALANWPARARVNAGYLSLNRALANDDPAGRARAAQQFAAAGGAPAARAQRGLGLLHMAAGQPTAAAVAWHSVPDAAGELTRWGQQAESAGDWAGAAGWYRLMINLNPQDGDAWHELARVTAQQGQPAAQLYQQALAAAEHVRFGRSNILTRLGELARNADPPSWAAALATFEDAARQDAFVDDHDRLLAALGRAEALDRLGQTAAALDAYRQIAAANPNHYWANVHSGRLSWYVARDAASAATYLERAIAVDDENYWAYLFLGGVYAESGQPERAIPLLQRVLELEPGNQTARQQLDRLMDGNGS